MQPASVVCWYDVVPGSMSSSADIEVVRIGEGWESDAKFLGVRTAQRMRPCE